MRRRLGIYLRFCAVLLISFVPADAAGVACGVLTPYECALSYFQRQDPGSAIVILRQYLEQQPQDLRALNLLGIALTATHDLPAANLEFEKALRENPQFYPALKNLAVNECTTGDISEAKMHFGSVLKLQPDDELTHFFLGEIAFNTKRCTEALQHYEKSRRRVMNDPRTVLRYSKCSLELGHREAAMTMLQSFPHSDAKYDFAVGTMLGQAGDYLDAAHFFELSRQGYPDPYSAGYNQALMASKGGDHAAAIRVANELIAQGIRKSELYNLLAEAYRKNDQIQEAYDSLRTATEIDPDDEDDYVDLAWLCLDRENYDLGIEITNIGLRHRPKSERLYMQRGVLRAEKGQTEESEQDFLMASKLAPDKALPYVALGIAWMQMSEFQKSIQMLRGKVRSFPTDFTIPYLYGEALIRSGAASGSPAEQEAFESFATSVRLNPNFVHAQTELGKLLLKRGKVDEAIVHLEKAVSVDAKDAAPVYQLAQAYRIKGQTARAQEMLVHLKTLHSAERTQFGAKDLVRIIREGTTPGSALETQ